MKMLKKFRAALLALVLVFAFAAPAFAATTVGLVFDADPIVTGNDKNLAIASEKAAAIFPPPAFLVLPAAETLSATVLFAEEIGKPPVEFDAATMQKLGREIGCDLIFFLNVGRGMTSDSYGFASQTQRADFFCDIAVFDVKTAKAVYTKPFNATYKQGATLLLGGTIDEKVWDKTYSKVIKRALDELDFNPARLK